MLMPWSVLMAKSSSASSFATPFVSSGAPCPLSLRQSYHVNARNPVVWSRAIFGLNWLLVVVSLLSLIGELHVAPESSECFSMMSMLLLSFGVSDVHIRYRRWARERSHISPTSASTEWPLCAGM